MTSQQDIIDQAVHWHLASQRDDMDWNAFTLWLEADPAHLSAYDEIALTDASLDSVQTSDLPPLAANDDGNAAPVGGLYRWVGGALAASLALLLGVVSLWPEDAQRYQTASDSMTIALGDGSQVILAPASELTVEGDTQIALAGAAYFDVRHDPSRQLSISTGGITITDIGTQFDVQTVGEDVRVAVSEGSVTVKSPRLSSPVALTAGRQWHYDAAAGRSVASPVDISAVGSWRGGQLSYAAVPFSLVSTDLSRYTGVQIEMPKEIGGRLFSGTLSIDDGNAAVRDFSQLMGLDLERSDDGGYRLSDPAD